MVRRFKIACAFASLIGLAACASAPPEETASQSSKEEKLDCLPHSFSFCDWKEVGHPDPVKRRVVVGYQIWGEMDENGNCSYGPDLATIRDAITNGRVPEVNNISRFEEHLCGFTPESCGIVVDDTNEGRPLPIVYGKCIEN
jgi:hypothetical protein